MIPNLILISLSIMTAINGTGNMTTYDMIGENNFTLNMSGQINMETAHIINGIPDAPPALQPRFPMVPPSM
jgi:hypothetical protein